MKKGFVVFLSVLVVSLCCTPVFSQPNRRSVETFIVDNFDVEQEWTWSVRTSRYVAEGFPKTGSFDAIPASLRVLRQEGDPDPKVYGVQIAFNRKGDNWFEVYPEKEGEPHELPLIGNVTQIDFWVWGANYRYFLDVLVRDADGRIHSLPAGSLAFKGWRNIVLNVPTWLAQNTRLRSGPRNMTFVGFRIRTDPEEFVDNYMVYFDQLKYTTNSLETVYDGYELQDAIFEEDK